MMPYHIFYIQNYHGKLRVLLKEYEGFIKRTLNRLINDLLKDPYDYEHVYNTFVKWIGHHKLKMYRYGKFKNTFSSWLYYYYKIANEFNFPQSDLYHIFQNNFFNWRFPEENSSYEWPKKDFAYERWLLNRRGYIKAFTKDGKRVQKRRRRRYSKSSRGGREQKKY